MPTCSYSNFLLHRAQRLFGLECVIQRNWNPWRIPVSLNRGSLQKRELDLPQSIFIEEWQNYTAQTWGTIAWVRRKVDQISKFVGPFWAQTEKSCFRQLKMVNQRSGNRIALQNYQQESKNSVQRSRRSEKPYMARLANHRLRNKDIQHLHRLRA